MQRPTENKMDPIEQYGAQVEAFRKKVEDYDSGMGGLLQKHAHEKWDVGQAEHMAGSLDGFTVPIETPSENDPAPQDGAAPL